jgi:putative endonuclease
MREYYVYIMTNQSRTLYTGVTNDLVRRVYEHKAKIFDGFTKRYNLNRLVYYESTSDVIVQSKEKRRLSEYLTSTLELCYLNLL